MGAEGAPPLTDAAKAQLARHASRKHLASDGFQDEVVAPPKEKKKAIKTKLAGWKHFVAGGVAGACEVIGTMPLDVAKTQMQINPGKYANPLDALVKIGHSAGLPGLYYGMPAFLTQTSAKAAIRFFGFAQCKELTTLMIGEKTAAENPTAVNFVSGLGAGAMEAAIWTTPMEKLKVVRQAEANKEGPKRFNSMIGTTRIIIQEEGVAGLFAGLTACVLRQASSVGFRFMCYDPVKNLIMRASGTEESVATFMLAGGTVGAISVVLNNPYQSGQAGTMVGMMRDIMAKDGVKGFSRGLSARVPRVFAGQAITFAVYEQAAKFLLTI
ncbi:Mitochondrial substrate carrier family protein Z [Hondaea fermentalgiana]|uniref:Mitochondrial substrate carrier family protein Z n=1 Tax=Hondaea fermentalgiana TaxID=2315210 RepID=A0A2R5GFA2_9STRA|nr:Mitochondrial substrate carrier family protein Z [Hondaea fermentalgiana]|eukprot:GBG29255.1 Mitochondrial substrate carrier family protein Z [Hondaea fermentalgiana]